MNSIFYMEREGCEAINSNFHLIFNSYRVENAES